MAVVHASAEPPDQVIVTKIDQTLWHAPQQSEEHHCLQG
jgi:hypothetical protein